jgi:hypothetical protein
MDASYPIKCFVKLFFGVRFAFCSKGHNAVCQTAPIAILNTRYFLSHRP